LLIRLGRVHMIYEALAALLLLGVLLMRGAVKREKDRGAKIQLIAIQGVFAILCWLCAMHGALRNVEPRGAIVWGVSWKHLVYWGLPVAISAGLAELGWFRSEHGTTKRKFVPARIVIWAVGILGLFALCVGFGFALPDLDDLKWLESTSNETRQAKITVVVPRKPPDGFTGTWKTYWSDGTLAREEDYRDGTRHGLITEYRRDGTKSLVAHCIDGEMVGKKTGYDVNGNKAWEKWAIRGFPMPVDKETYDRICAERKARREHAVDQQHEEPGGRDQ